MRRTLIAVGLVAALLALGAFAAWLARLPLATAWLDAALERHGYPEARFEITRLGWNLAVVEGVAVEPPDGPEVTRVEARYAPLSLLLGNRRHVRVTLVGLQLELDPWAAGEGTATAAPGGPPPSPAEIAAALGGLPHLRLEGATLRLRSPYGTWRVEADGRVGPGEGAPEGDLTATATNRRLRVDARLDARLRGGRLDAELSAREDDGAMIRVGARADAPWREPRVELDVEGELPAGADLPWALLPGPAPAAGNLVLSGSAAGRLDAGSWPSGVAAVVERFAAGDWGGDWRVRGRGLALSHRLGGVDVDARGRIDSREGALAVVLDEDEGASVASVHESLRALLPVPAGADRYVTGPLRVSWPGGELLRLIPPQGDAGGVRVSGSPVLAIAWPGQPGRLSLQAGLDARLGGDGPLRDVILSDLALEARDLAAGDSRVDRLQLTGDVHDLARQPRGYVRLVLDAPRLAAGDLVLDGVEAEVSMDLESGESGVQFAVAEEGAVRAAGWRAGERLQAADGGVVASLEGGRLRLRGGAAWELDLAVEPFLAHLDAAGGVQRIEIEPGPVRVASDAGGLRLVARDTRVAHAAEPAWFAPARISGRVERTPAGYTVSGEGELGEPGVAFTLSGAGAPAAGAASLRVSVPPVRFRPGGPQPATLAPALRMIRAAEGRAGGSVRIQVRPEGIDGTARLTLEDVSFRMQRVRVEGLDGTLALDGLRPLRAATDQALRAASVEAGVPVTDAHVRFGLVHPPGGGTAVAIADAGGNLFGGRLGVRDWTFDPGAQVHSLTVRVDGIELARLLEHLGIDGLEGRGALSGQLPVTVADGVVAVRDGRIRGRGGRIALRSQRAASVLTDGTRATALMLEALRDFDYETLAVGIERTLRGATDIRIELVGSNPAVQDGERFDFDIRLVGDAGPLLDALAQGRPLTNDLIERSLDLTDADESE